MSQPEPKNPKSPYFELARKYNLKIDFKPFVQVEGIPSKDFRHQKINILDFTRSDFYKQNRDRSLFQDLQ